MSVQNISVNNKYVSSNNQYRIQNMNINWNFSWTNNIFQFFENPLIGKMNDVFGMHKTQKRNQKYYDWTVCRKGFDIYLRLFVSKETKLILLYQKTLDRKFYLNSATVGCDRQKYGRNAGQNKIKLMELCRISDPKLDDVDLLADSLPKALSELKDWGYMMKLSCG